jgi:hypothetical protein
MSDQEVIDILRKFTDFLSIGNIFTDSIRWLGWLFVKGLTMIVDGMASVTDTILLTKELFNNPEVLAFVETIRPLLWVLLAISLAFTGYMLIFQRKLNAETIGINLIVAISILVLLSDGMNKVNDFTDEAINTINNSALFSSENGTVSENILSRNITDLVEFDGDNWNNPEKVQSLPLNLVRNIKITEKFDPEKLDIENEEVAKSYLSWENGEVVTAEFEQGGLASWNNEYYYRFSPDWLTIIVTLAIMGFTLFSIAYKLARLSFELVFNQLLVTIIAPIDIHDGQKMKKILQNIMSIFIVVILIFLSMKLYIIGTAWLENNLEGFAYLIALIGFSVALLDGPNIVERLFGIDAGLKNGWGLLIGAVTTAKLTTNLAKGASNMAKGNSNSNSNDSNNNDGKDNKNEANNDGKQSPLSKVKPKSPFDNGKDNAVFGQNGEGEGEGTDVQGSDSNDLSGNGGTENKSGNKERQENVDVASTKSANVNTTGGNSQGQVSAAELPFGEDPSMNGEMQQVSSVTTASRQMQADQQVNVNDRANTQQSFNTTGENNITEGNSIGNSTQAVQQPSPVNDEMQQVSSATTALRQMQADQQVNVNDRANTQQSFNTTGENNITESNSIGNSTQAVQQPSPVNDGMQQVSSATTALRQMQADQQVNIVDTVNVQQSMNTTQQELNTSSSGLVQSGSSANPNQEVIQQSTNDVVTQQKTVQSENVQTVNEEILVNENLQTVQGSQSVSKVTSGSNSEGFVPKFNGTVMQNAVEENNYVINNSSKEERLERIKNREKVKS